MSIDKIKTGDDLTQSLDIVSDNISKLKELFPEVLTEGKIDFKVLQDILGNEIEEEEEFYRFTWAGKSQSRREAHKPSTGTLRPCKEESVDWDTTQNLYIEGDNLEVLKLLQKSYSNKVKMIYIDPPYNTGKDFVYKDNYKDNLKNYQQVTGQVDSDGNKMSTNSESDGRYHSNWLNMMYPRLKLARNLLTDDGAIFMSIDDCEYENLKKLSTEIYGEENFFADMIVVRAEGGGLAKRVIKGHDYLLVFAKSLRNFKGIYKPKDVRGKIVNKEGRDFWIEEDWLRKEFGKYGTLLYEEIEEIKGIEKKNEIDEGIKNGLYTLIKKQNGSIVGRYRALDEDGTKFYSILKHLNKNGIESLRELGLETIFDFPKPITLLKEIVYGTTIFTSNKSEIILDFFSGSSSTAHSIIQLNSEDKGNRKFIMVQLPEPTDEKSEAFKSGYKTITEIGKERIRRAGKKIKEENPLLSGNLDTGFKVFKLDSSNIKGWDGLPDNLENSLFESQDNIKSDRTEEDVLFEILLKYGLDLTLPIEEKIIEGKKVFNVGFGALFICLGNDLTSKVAEGIGQWKETLKPETCRVIFKDGGFTDVEKTNSVQTLKRFGIQEIKSI